MNRGSLRLRLFLAGAVSILAALVLSAIGLPLLFENHVERRVASELGVYLDQLVAGLDNNAGGALVVVKPPADPRFEQPISGLYWQIQAGDRLLRSRSLWDVKLTLPAEASTDGAVHRYRIAGPADSVLIALERRITLPARLGGGGVQAIVALDSAELTAGRRDFAADLLPYLVLIGFFLMVAAYAQVAVGLRPLVAVRRRLAAIRQGKSRRLGRTFPDEILPLADEVDALLDARESQIERARARAGDLAHGLKTPLQVLSGDIQRLREKGEGAIADEIEQIATTMRRHVDRELARARSAAGAPDARARVAEIVERILAVVVRTPEGARIDWPVDIAPELWARIDADDLAEALGNLVENAARHARSRVTVSARRRDGKIVMSIVDDGPGIPEERLAQALARGGRLDRLGDGSGLGLAIVRDIADAWGGQFVIHTGTGGLEVTLSIPDIAAA